MNNNIENRNRKESPFFSFCAIIFLMHIMQLEKRSDVLQPILDNPSASLMRLRIQMTEKDYTEEPRILFGLSSSDLSIHPSYANVHRLGV
jgi:hypothetical protein